MSTLDKVSILDYCIENRIDLLRAFEFIDPIGKTTLFQRLKKEPHLLSDEDWAKIEGISLEFNTIINLEGNIRRMDMRMRKSTIRLIEKMILRLWIAHEYKRYDLVDRIRANRSKLIEKKKLHANTYPRFLRMVKENRVPLSNTRHYLELLRSL